VPVPNLFGSLTSTVGSLNAAKSHALLQSFAIEDFAEK